MPTSQHYLDRQAKYESNARTYPRKLPLAIARASGIRVTDSDGRVFIDCLAGAGTLALGHNHPVVVDAIRRHLDASLPLHTLDLTSPVKDAFVSELFDSLPQSFAGRAKVQFCGPSGADAVEATLKLVKTATGRRTILAFHGGYHGQTHGALALMGNLGPKAEVPGLMPDVHFLPFPYPFRCPFGADGDWRPYARYVEHLLDDPESGVLPPAGLIVEVVQGEGGCLPAPVGWLREIRRITEERGIPLVLDEIQTGWGRTGTLYAFEQAGILPDALVLSKAIGGGLPLAVVVYDERLDVWKPGAHTGTFRGNQLGMATGLATLRYIRETGLAEHAARVGECLRQGLGRLLAAYPFLAEVRGRGLMIGVEVIDSTRCDRLGRFPGDGELARRIQRACFDLGLIVELGGRGGAVVRFLPPLILQDSEAAEVTAIFAAACAATA